MVVKPKRNPHYCGLTMTCDVPRNCVEEYCGFWVNSSEMCAMKEMAHSLKLIKEVAKGGNKE